MGRKKIAITRLTDERNRQITFSKRKTGLLKKAYELSILCDVEIAVIMITNNKKLYQYASSNMNSILIKYTDFKDPDENKTNADILDDITKKERPGGENDSEEEDSTSNFLLTPRTQDNYRKMDEQLGQILDQRQIPAQRPHSHPPLGSAPPGVPQVMPVSVPVSKSLQQTIQQHLVSREQRTSLGSAQSALSSAFMSPQSSDLSSASPLGKGDRPPGAMPPPMNTPTRLQTIRNQTLKLHLPGSGRSYIQLPSGGLSAGSQSGEGEPKKSAEPPPDATDTLDKAGDKSKVGGKPQLRVYIPGQKEFVPRTQVTSPLPQVTVPVQTTSSTGLQPPVTTSSVDSLTTPVLNLQTPSLYSNIQPMFSSLMGDFPFGQPSSTTHTTTGGGDSSSSAALVAFPVSIQPSGGTGPGNLILHAQNLGQPFLLTPNVNDSRPNPIQGFTPPAGSSLATMSPNIKDLDQLKAQYERTQQLIHQQLLFSQIINQQTSRPPTTSVTQSGPSYGAAREMDSGLGGQESDPEGYINGTDVMMGSEERAESGDEPLPKRSRLDNSPTSIVQV